MGGNDIEWRNQIEERLNYKTDKTFTYINPIYYRNLGLPETEFDKWNIGQIGDSDIAIVNMDELDDKTLYELGFIDAINHLSTKNIYVVGFGSKTPTTISTYVDALLFHYESDWKSAIDYIFDYIII